MQENMKFAFEDAADKILLVTWSQESRRAGARPSKTPCPTNWKGRLGGYEVRYIFGLNPIKGHKLTVKPVQSRRQHGRQEQLAREGILPQGLQLPPADRSTWVRRSMRIVFYVIFLTNLVEDKHEESTQATSDRVHHDIGDHIDGSGDGGQGEGHLW